MGCTLRLEKDKSQCSQKKEGNSCSGNPLVSTSTKLIRADDTPVGIGASAVRWQTAAGANRTAGREKFATVGGSRKRAASEGHIHTF